MRASSVTGVDTSPEYIDFAKAHVANGSVRFKIADAQMMPFGNASFDAVVSGLALNFVPDAGKATVEMRRVVRSSGGVAVEPVWSEGELG
jgi:ubiquinone/menaquinone biosynthesis C-methylase UbiE